jgi:hypothetical protein
VFEKGARGLQVVAEMLHLGAGLCVFGAHLIDHATQFADLILQFADGGGGVSWRSGSGRLLRPQV